MTEKQQGEVSAMLRAERVARIRVSKIKLSPEAAEQEAESLVKYPGWGHWTKEQVLDLIRNDALVWRPAGWDIIIGRRV